MPLRLILSALPPLNLKMTLPDDTLRLATATVPVAVGDPAVNVPPWTLTLAYVPVPVAIPEFTFVSPPEIVPVAVTRSVPPLTVTEPAPEMVPSTCSVPELTVVPPV